MATLHWKKKRAPSKLLSGTKQQLQNQNKEQFDIYLVIYFYIV